MPTQKANSPSAIDGVWQMIRGEFAGEQAPALVAQKTQIEFNAGAYTVRFDGEISDRGTYHFDSSMAAPNFLLKGEMGPNAGRTIPSIYQLIGDRLRICFGLDGAIPTDFATAVKQQRYLVTYRRAQIAS